MGFEQLTAQDASFLYTENEQVANHVGGMYIYDQSTVPGGVVGFKQILSHLEAHLHMVPRYRQKLKHVPGDLDHPYWVDDQKFDIEYHVRHMALPQPGDWRQLCILASRIYDRPLDMSRPLWLFYVIEGLGGIEGMPDGAFAVVTKTHHAMIDGVSGTAMMTAIHNTSPDSPLPEAPVWKAEPAPNDMELLSRAYLNNLTQPLKLLQALGETIPASQRVIEGMRESKFSIPEAIATPPRTRFNGEVSGHKVLEAAEFLIPEMRAVKNAVPGATLNDVVLAIGGGALRKYLLDKGELPEESLITLSPISVRSKEAGDPTNKATAAAGGNDVSGMLVELGTNLENPLDRLKKVHDSAVNSKELTSAIGAKTLTDFSQFIPGVTMGLASRLASSLNLATQVQPIVNTVITNVPGPQFPLYFCGAEMVNQWSLGIVQDGLALFHGILSYNGKLTITAMSDRDVMPDPAFYRQCMEEAFEELKVATGVTATPVTKKTPAAKKPPVAKKAAPRKAAPRKAAPKKTAAKKPVAKTSS